jgi:hypothetical protein
MRFPAFRLTRRRFLVFLALLLVVVIASFWVIPWLLMPRDLWRMQGEWKLVRVETKDSTLEATENVVTITGSRLRLNSKSEYMMLRVQPTERTFELVLLEAPERTLLGFKVPVPPWLMTPRRSSFGDYELSDKRLVLHVRGSRDPATGDVTEEFEKAYLERPARR